MPSATQPRTTDLIVSIGGVAGRITLGAAPGPFLDQIRARYEAFLLPPAEWVDHAFSLRLTFRPAAPIGPRGREADMKATPLTVDSGKRNLKIDRWDFDARLGPQTSRGRPRWAGSARCEMNPFSFDSLMRVLWSIFLPREGGALFHACGLRRAEIGVIFPGQSGAGKTTLARKLEDPDHVLSDEIVAVRRDDRGRWRVWGSPFWGEFQRGGISLRSWPLRALAFLEQATPVAVSPLTSSEGALRALQCFVCFQSDAATVAQNLAIAVSLCSELRCLTLQSARQTTPAELFRNLDPHLGADITRRTPPLNAREMISEFRSFLKTHKTYAFKPKGGSMRPWLRAGDSLFIEAAGESQVKAGDILLYWSPGERPEDDALTCHRMVARVGKGSEFLTKGDALSTIERFENGRQSLILGRVTAISRDGKTWPVPGRVGNLARLFGSLVAMPILKLAGR
jgi:hypothetical protein